MRVGTIGLIASLGASAVGCTYPRVVNISAIDGGNGDGSTRIDVPVVRDVADVVTADAVDVPVVTDAGDACVPSGAETCDGRDNDCDGTVDNVPAAALAEDPL